MRISMLTAAALSAIANAKLGDNEDANLNHIFTSVSEMGAGHTEAFNKLAELYKSKKPSSKEDMMEDLITVVSSMCDSNDNGCGDRSRIGIETQFELEKNGRDQMRLRDDFDSDTLDSLNSMFSVINTLTTDEDVDKVLEALLEIENEIKSSNPLNPVDKVAALAGLSIAKESSKLWHDVYKNEDHPLHGLHHTGFYSQENRELDEDYDYDYDYDDDYKLFGLDLDWFKFPDINVTGFVIADIETAIESFRDDVNASVDNVFPFGDNFFETIGDILGETIAASAAIGAEADYENNTRV